MKATLSFLICLSCSYCSIADTYETFHPSGPAYLNGYSNLCVGETLTLQCYYNTCSQVSGSGGDPYLLSTGTTVEWYVNSVDTNWGGVLLAYQSDSTGTDGSHYQQLTLTENLAGHFYYYCEIIPDSVGCGGTLVSNTLPVSVGVAPSVVAVVPTYSASSKRATFTLNPVAGAADSFMIILSPAPLVGVPVNDVTYHVGDAVGNGAVLRMLPGQADSFIVDGLTPNTNYYFSIMTFNNCGAPKYRTDTFWTIKRPTCLAQPDEWITDITSTSFVLHWNSVTDGGYSPLHYYVQVSKNPGFYTITHDLTLGSSTFSATISDLNPTKIYYYRVFALADLSCEDYGLDVDSVINMNTVGVSALILTEDVKIYPNPGSGDMEVDFGRLTDECTISLTDLSGKILYSDRCEHAQKVVIPRGNFPKGVYLLHLMTKDGKSTTKKVVWL